MSDKYESRRSFLKKTTLIGAAAPFARGGSPASGSLIEENIDRSLNVAARAANVCSITLSKKSAAIRAGDFIRRIDFDSNQIITQNLRLNNVELLSGPSSDFQFCIYQAIPNACPSGLKLVDDGKLIWSDNTPATKTADNQPVEWKRIAQLDGKKLSDSFKIVSTTVTSPKQGVTRLNIRARSFGGTLQGMFLDVYYETYDGYPAIRKWIRITNNGNLWLKIDQLVIDDIDLISSFKSRTPLTPEEQDTESSIVAFGTQEKTAGLIAASEIPSGTRHIGENGAMGYADDYFEWVLGPSETFISEPVFYFAYAGDVVKTISGHSTPLDRATEGPFKYFLQNCVGLRGDPALLPAPIWCSYTNFLVTLTDENMRGQADIAEKIGFVTFQLDEGWAGTPSPGGSEPYLAHMPDFDNTCKYILSKGLKLGLWISCFRSDEAKDLKALPDAKSLPLSINTKRGVGMSFASKWRDYFANDIVYMADRYGMSYVKQDLTNISKGDIAEGHDSRTRKESILRGLRGLFELNKKVSDVAPEMWTQITHELYWRTPGPPADIAGLKYACAFHTTPNTYMGSGYGSKRVSQDWPLDPLKLRSDLIKSCEQARHRFFDHRGLPLYSVEFYAAHAVNIKGSLIASVQDRQICSWLMGGPTVYAGDLSSLTEEHIAHYRKRFDLLKELQSKYEIYSYFQFSGVPAPTDSDWHWWGKLNRDGCGVVVVLRGNGGLESRMVNIPWVNARKKYTAVSRFAGKKLGVFTGEQLIRGAVKLDLPVLGQEIIEVSLLS
jgi:hypothetical protein